MYENWRTLIDKLRIFSRHPERDATFFVRFRVRGGKISIEHLKIRVYAAEPGYTGTLVDPVTGKTYREGNR